MWVQAITPAAVTLFIAAYRSVSDGMPSWVAVAAGAAGRATCTNTSQGSSSDPAGRGRQFVSSYLDKPDGTRAAGFVFRRYPPEGRWSTSLFGLEVADEAVVLVNAEARRKAADAQPEPGPWDR